MPSEAVADPRVQRTRRDVIDAASSVLLDDGWAGVTHAAVAKRAGYSRATLYSHWPTRFDLVSDAVVQICASADHPEPTGDLRSDLVRELVEFGDGLTKGHLARLLGGVLERSRDDAAVDRLRDLLYAEGTHTLDEILRSHLPAAEVEPALAQLAGAVLIMAGFHEDGVSLAFIEGLVDRVLSAAEPGDPRRSTRDGS